MFRHESALGSWEMAYAAPGPALRGGVQSYCGYVERTTQPLRRREAATGFYYLAVDDAAAAFELATSAGANLTSELESREYGGREFSLRDPEGNLWSVGEYDPSRAP